MSALPRCSVCGGGYRPGRYAEHLTTQKHERALRGRIVRYRPSRRSSRNYGQDTGAPVSVRAHRRSLPDDGSARVVKVDHYRRSYPWLPGGESMGRIRRRLARIARRRHRPAA